MSTSRSYAHGRGARTTWLVHAGALGDFVMIWPMIRALTATGREVTVVAPSSKAALCAEELGVNQVSMETPRFTRMWHGPSAIKPSDQEEGVSEVYSFVADETTEGGKRWLQGAGAAFPGARIIPVGPPGSVSRAAAWRATGASGPDAMPEPRENHRGPVVIHVGAGAAAKRWPMERWRELVLAIGSGAIGSPAPSVQLLAGEVEAEQFGAGPKRLFLEMSGRFLTKLGELASAVSGARLFIGADSGPTHLAAQLGVPTVALFGPTDPGIWKPVGPSVQVVSRFPAAGLEGIESAEVLAAAQSIPSAWD